VNTDIILFHNVRFSKAMTNSAVRQYRPRPTVAWWEDSGRGTSHKASRWLVGI